MNVLHISTPLSWRGGEQQLAYLVEELVKQNVSQWILCSEKSELEKYCVNNKIKFITQPKPSSYSLISAFRIANACKRLKIDLVHVHDSHSHSVAVLSATFFRNKAPIVLSRKVDFPIRKNFLSNYKYNHSSIKKIICVSDKIREILSANISNRNILQVVYDGIDLSKFKYKSEGLLRKEFSISADELIIGNVAAIAPHKDYFTFVDTAEILLKRNVKARFFVVGDGPERRRIEEYIKSKKLNHKIILTGFRNDVPKVLPEFDYFLFTSKTEGLGSSILDAYACEVPVVATAAGGVPEIVFDGKTGLLSPPQAPILLAENVLKLINNQAQRMEQIQNAKEFVKGFSKEKTAEKTLLIYTEIISSCRKDKTN